MLQPTPQVTKLADHLFRHEAGKLVAVLTHIFGAGNVELAEDVVQDALVEAMSHWQYKGIPDDPVAWLYRVAKNKALNIVNRDKYKLQHASGVTHYLQSKWTAEPAFDHLFSEKEIQDDQLKMIFTCCHPAISTDSQIAFALKTLCGFSIPEIAKAFLTTEENIKKRLVRARQNIREAKIPFEIPQGEELEKRLDTVLETIYLLFNEGYSASKGNEIIRYGLCEEAIRLAEMIAAGNAIQNKGNVYALLSQMYSNAARFTARQDEDGNLIAMADQNRALWNIQMKEAGISYLNQAAKENKISVYHILAAISALHNMAPSFEDTNWQGILSLYNSLIEIEDSPLVLLNRTIAVMKVNGPQTAIEEMEKIEHIPSIQNYHLLYSTKAEFYIQLQQYDKAAGLLKKAIRLTPLQAEKDLLEKKLVACQVK